MALEIESFAVPKSCFLLRRYDVRLLLGDVAAFARQNCSEERRLAKLQENREIEDMRYEARS